MSAMNPAAVVLPVVKQEPQEAPTQGETTTFEPSQPEEAPIPDTSNATLRNATNSNENGEILFFTQVQVDATKKCFNNTRLVIKDFETQLDWHLQQYMTLRSMGKTGNGATATSKGMMSIAEISAAIAEANQNFIKGKNKTNGKKTKKVETDSESDLDDEESDSEEDDDEDGYDSAEIDDPSEAGSSTRKRGRKRRMVSESGDDSLIVPKDEIEEEIHELIVPKEEQDDEYISSGPRSKQKGKSAKGVNRKTSKEPIETIDLTKNMKPCAVVLDRMDQN